MRALTSDSINLIHFEVNQLKIKDLKSVHLDIEVQTTFDESSELCGIRLKWRFRGVSSKRIEVFNFLVEHTFDRKYNVLVSIHATRLLVYKSYSIVVEEFNTQMIEQVAGTVKTPTVLDENIILRVQTAIQTPKRL